MQRYSSEQMRMKDDVFVTVVILALVKIISDVRHGFFYLPVSCIVVLGSCPLPKTSSHLAIRDRRRFSGGVEEGETITFFCSNSGYALDGPVTVTCRRDGTLSEPIPRCLSRY